MKEFKNQFLLKDSRRFLEFHLSDEGYDFTLYDAYKTEIDGGCIEYTSFQSERELLDEITCFLEHIEPKVNLNYDNLTQIDDIENYNYRLEKVKEIMSYIEDITSKGDYSCFELALLITERGDINHNEINEELIDKVEDISDSYSSLFDENINIDLEDVFNDFKENNLDKEDLDI